MKFVVVFVSFNLPVYLLMALSYLSLFCCLYPWSLLNFTFCLMISNYLSIQ